MASEENVKDENCICDPNFAIVCSFFENFSSLCGIQAPSFLELQQMLEDTQFTAPQLIDLHVRLMRKAKKNVNPDRWQKTMARFCWYNQPDDCWLLEQKGYEHLNYSQRLKFLLTLIGAQFDYNTKFKTDVNKLDVKDLRLQPVGRDKNGRNYWVHFDQETTLKVYKEDLDEEKWELIAEDREGLTKLIDELMKEKDPNRKLEEIPDSEESESSSEEEFEPEPKLENGAEKKEENGQNVSVEDEKQQKNNEEDDSEEGGTSETIADSQSVNSVPRPSSEIQDQKTELTKKMQQAFNEKPLKKSPLELISRPRSSFAPSPVKPLDKESLAQHLQKMDSINMLKPLLTNTEPGKELNPTAIKSDLLKTKINQKFSIIKPKLEPTGKTSKPGLKLEQILKSKLAQKLSENASSEVANPADEAANAGPTKSEETKVCAIEKRVAESENEKPEGLEAVPAKKSRMHASNECDEEIEEPVMVVKGVGNGHDCNSSNYEDEEEIEEPIMFVYGVGSGSECTTGNNENDESSNKSGASHTAHLTHKVDNMLKSEAETTTPSTSAPVETTVPDTEKKKPKLWTIDAICNSDSSKESKRESVSQFPNFSFNKDVKRESPIPYRSASESYSIFSLTESKDSRDAATVIPTNFYFGSNNQNPCFLPTELSPNFKSNAHSVESLVENASRNVETGPKMSKFSAENLYAKTNNIKEVEKVETHSALVHSSVSAAPVSRIDQGPEFVSKDQPSHREANLPPKAVTTHHSSTEIVQTIVPTHQSCTNEPKRSFVTDHPSPEEVMPITAPSSIVKSPDSVALEQSAVEKMEVDPVEPSTSSVPVEQVEIVRAEPTKLEKPEAPLPNEEPEQIDYRPVSIVSRTDIVEERKSDSIITEPDRSIEQEVFEKAETLVVNRSSVSNSSKGTESVEKEVEPEPVLSKNDLIPAENKSPDSKHTVSDCENADREPENVRPLTQMTEDSAVHAGKVEVLESIQPVGCPVETVAEKVPIPRFEIESKHSASAEQVLESDSSEPKYAVNEEEVCNIESRNEEGAPILKEPTPDVACNLVTKPSARLDESCKTDEQRVPDAEMDADNTEKSNQVAANEAYQSVQSENVTSQPNEKVDERSVQTVAKDEKKVTDVEIETDKEEKQHQRRDLRKNKVDAKPDSPTKEAVPAQKQTKEAEIADSEPDETVSPPQKELKKGKQKKSVDVTESTSNDTDSAQKKVDNELEETAETRRTTRSSRSRKSDVESGSEKMEKVSSKKSLKNVKPKNEITESVKTTATPRATRGSRSSDEVKQTLPKKSLEEGESDAVADLETVKTASHRATRGSRSGDSEAKQTLPKKSEDEMESEVAANSETVKATISKGSRGTRSVENQAKPTSAKKADEGSETEAMVDTEDGEKTTETLEDAVQNEIEDEIDTTPKKEVKKPAKKGKKKKRYGKKTAKPKTPKKENKSEQENHSESESNVKNVSESAAKEKDDSSKKEPSEPKKKRIKRGWLSELDVSGIEESPTTDSPGIRQSRRIAQLKIKEQAETKYQETIDSPKKGTANQKSKAASPSKKNKSSKGKLSKFKPSKDDSDEDTYYEFPSSKKKRKTKKDRPKKNFDPKKAWKQSSESSSEEEDEEDHFEEEDEELVVNDKSDHEFSPESDIEDAEYQPVKRARTAHSKPRTEDKLADLACQSCGTIEQPEWILLCDSCDEGWHAACLKPPVMAIPEGDWFCPPCQHNKLITGLQTFLKTYDKAVKKRASEESRRKRLEFVNISFSNIIKEEAAAKREEKLRAQSSSSSEESSSQESEEEDEPLYQLRVRRQVNVRHRLNEYEELMNSAIEREDGDIPFAQPVEMQTNVNGAVENEPDPGSAEVKQTEPEEKKASDESTEDEEDEEEGEEKKEDEKEKELPIILQLRNVRKKPARLTNLDVSSEDDHYSDEDFKGSSADDQEEEDEYGKSETDSDEASYRRGRGGREPVRRSTRARRTRYDNDFINDDSEEDDEDEGFSRKKTNKRVRYSESDSEEEDSTWGRRKRNKNSVSHRPKAPKRRRRIRFDGDSDEDRMKKKNSNRNSRIQYGLDEDNESYLTSRRTRGRKINYQDDLDSESEEEDQSSRLRNKSRKIVSDDEYVNEEDEQNASKESVASENGEHSDSDSESDGSEGPPKAKQSKTLESDDSASSPVKEPTSTQEERISEKPAEDVSAADPKPDPVIEKSVIKSEPMDRTEKRPIPPLHELQLPKETLKSGMEIPPPKMVDQNPSLQRMQSMAQNLSQPMPPTHFPANMLPPDAAFPGPLPPIQQAPIPVNYEVNVKYETPDGMPPMPGPESKYPHPIRVPSPNKMYGMLPPDMQPGNRPLLPPFMQPPMGGPPGATSILPRSTRPMPPAIPIPRGPMAMQAPPMLPRPPHMAPPPPNVSIGQPLPNVGIGQPPPNVNIAQCGPPGSMIPPNVSISPVATPETAPPKRRPRGRGKKQLEMERLQREREAMEANRSNDEMIPLHVLKIPSADASAVAAGHPGMMPPFSTYQRMAFPHRPPPPIQQQAGSISAPTVTTSKRVKITPTRMRLPTPPDKILHIPRSPGSAGAMYPPVRHPPVPVTSASGNGQPTPGDGKPPPVSSAPSTPTLPTKSEAGAIRPESAEQQRQPQQQQYYHPSTPYPPSQGPRVYGPRPEYASFGRKPPPPGMYQTPPPANTAPNVVVNRTGGFANNARPPPVSSPNVKSESPSVVTQAPPTSVPQPYPAPYPMPPRLPTTAPSSVASKPAPSAPYITTPASRPLGPPGLPPVSSPSGYPGPHPLIKTPPQSTPPTSPYTTPPYYATRPPYPPSTQAPPPPVSFSHTVPTSNFSPSPPTTVVTASSHPHSPGSSTPETNNTLSSLPPTSQSNEFQYAPRPADTPSEPPAEPEETPPAEETSSGEFGGLVSYFSSQHEDDLDA